MRYAVDLRHKHKSIPGNMIGVGGPETAFHRQLPPFEAKPVQQ